MRPRNSIYIGDRQLDPDDEPEPVTETCKRCGGWGWIDDDPESSGDCLGCQGTGQIELTESERQQKAFDDFDPPDDGDFGEPL